MSSCRKVTLASTILFTMTSLILYRNIHQTALRVISNRKASLSSALGLQQQQLFRTYRDLSFDFETDRRTAYDIEGDYRLNVLQALIRDGHTPVAVSEVEVYRSSDPESTHPCSSASLSATKQVATATPHNLSEVASNKSKTDDGPCNPATRVPNVVHYVFLGSDLNFTFTNYLSYRSVDRFIRPDQIFVHGDRVPSGKWWNRTVDEVKNIYHVNRTYSNKAPNGKLYKFPAHISDYMRAETLLSYGGIYMDSDVLVVKSFNPLRQFPFVIGREVPGGLCNGIMVAERGAPFLRLMLEQYRSYLGPAEAWADKSVFNSDTIARLYPHLVHVEETTLNRPNWKEKAQIYSGKYDWSKNYAVHLWMRLWPKEKRPNGVQDILTGDTTFAELARLAVFGSHEVIKLPTNITYL